MRLYIYMRFHQFLECDGAPQGCYNLEQVFLHSNRPLKSFKIISKAMIDTIVHPCEVWALDLKRFEWLGYVALVSWQSRALEFFVTFPWRRGGLQGDNPPFLVWSCIVLVGRRGDPLPHVDKLHNGNSVSRWLEEPGGRGEAMWLMH